MEPERRLYRSREDRMISGVCAGIADYFGIDPTVVRLLAVVLLVVGNVATLIAYIVLAIVLPEAPDAAQTASGRTEAPAATGDPSEESQEASTPAVAAPAPEPVTGSTWSAAEVRTHHRSGRVSGGLTAGLVLIAIGVILLVGRVDPAWGIWNLWPVIIIVAGFIQAITPDRNGWGVERFFDGLTTAAIGGVFLGITTGYLNWSVWWRVLTLWPVLLIAIGLGVLGGAIRQSWVKALGSVVIIAALGFAAATSYAGVPAVVTSGGETYAFSEPRGGVREARFELSAGVGEVQIGDAKGLVKIEGASPFGAPAFEVERTGQSAAVSFDQGGRGTWIGWPTSEGSRVEAGLGRDVAWDAVIDAGVASVRADLTDVPIRSIEVRTGVSDSVVELGGVPDGVPTATALVKGGVSSIRIVIPEGTEARVEASTALVGLSAGGGLDRVGGDIYKTAGYDRAKSRGDSVWDIRVESAVGSVNITTGGRS